MTNKEQLLDEKEPEKEEKFVRKNGVWHNSQGEKFVKEKRIVRWIKTKMNMEQLQENEKVKEGRKNLLRGLFKALPMSEKWAYRKLGFNGSPQFFRCNNNDCKIGVIEARGNCPNCGKNLDSYIENRD